MINWQLVLESLVYGGLAMVLMFVGVVIIDWAISSYGFTQEIKEKNAAVGYMIAGIFIAVGIIVKSVIA